MIALALIVVVLIVAALLLDHDISKAIDELKDANKHNKETKE